MGLAPSRSRIRSLLSPQSKPLGWTICDSSPATATTRGASGRRWSVARQLAEHQRLEQREVLHLVDDKGVKVAQPGRELAACAQQREGAGGEALVGKKAVAQALGDAHSLLGQERLDVAGVGVGLGIHYAARKKARALRPSGGW